MRLISLRSRSSSAAGTVTCSPRTFALRLPLWLRIGTSPLPAMSPPSTSAPASYTFAAARNFRKHRSDPWMSVAKKRRRARFLPAPAIRSRSLCDHSGGSSRMARSMSMDEDCSLLSRTMK